MNPSSAPSPPARPSSRNGARLEGEAIRTIAVVGAGPLAVRFVERCLSTGFHVVLEDVLPSNLRSASAALRPVLGGESGGSLQIVHTVEDAVRTADIAIDFVPDELESKLEIASMVDRMAPPRTLFCTPTDALSIADLASCTYRPERCFALHHLAAALADDRGQVELRFSYPPAVLDTAKQTLEQLLGVVGFVGVPEPDLLPSQLTPRR